MANRNWYPSWSFGANRVWCDFELIGSATPASIPPTLSTDAPQAIVSVVRIGAGVYDVTFKDAFGKVIRADASLNDSLNDGGYANVGAITNEGTSSPLVIRVYTRAAAGTAAELTTGRRLGVSLVLRNGRGWGFT